MRGKFLGKTSFVRQNADAIDRQINKRLYLRETAGMPGTIPQPPPTYSERDRIHWLSHDETLYNWARSEGVRL